MRRMEQYFPVRWANLSKVIRFQVSRENAKSSNGRLFYLYGLLALGLLEGSEINNVLGDGDNYRIRIFRLFRFSGILGQPSQGKTQNFEIKFRKMSVTFIPTRNFWSL